MLWSIVGKMLGNPGGEPIDGCRVVKTGQPGSQTRVLHRKLHKTQKTFNLYLTFAPDGHPPPKPLPTAPTRSMEFEGSLRWVHQKGNGFCFGPKQM